MTTFDVQVLPAWRPDKAMNIEKPDLCWITWSSCPLSAACRGKSFRSLKGSSEEPYGISSLPWDASVSDHALEYVMYAPASDDEMEDVSSLKRLNRTKLSTREEELKFKTAFMLFVGTRIS